ncbi:hypothetical protein M407DRAFT_244707 [Tulasnella calospora MUT 4182]|uniref:Uncharacterized protein n=1 Tax=Tulasnella calospora MUT 4182 TaxID=1051891 RepID=A0A0C3QEX6_9AGAM|nr:hypothetical protein M407DRAFT_244707 [Tulasnella calospora MUT 4182]
MSASSPVPDPVDPSPASEFDYWLREEYFLSPSRGEETPYKGEREDDDLAAYRRGMDAVDFAMSEKM